VKTGARIIVDIDGLAASIASIVAMAGDEIRIAHNGYMMIHDPWSVIGGTADDFRQMADTMDKIRDTLLQTYCKREGADEETLSSMMSAETWLTAQEALEQGLVDTVSEPVAMAALASCELKNFKNVPDALAKALKEPEGNVERNLTRRAKLAAMGQAARKSRS
jgi:ATP-dependent protease ClpP protease subunit